MKIKIVKFTSIMLLAVLVIASYSSVSAASIKLEDVNNLNQILTVNGKTYNNIFEYFVKSFIASILNPFKPKNTFELKSFETYGHLKQFLKENGAGQQYWGLYLEDGVAIPNISSKSGISRDSTYESLSGSNDYSKTNIQVEGVDEPDTVKTDGKYLYILANSKIYIINAFPANEAEILSEIQLNADSYTSNIFIDGDRLVVLGMKYDYEVYAEVSDDIAVSQCIWPTTSKTSIEFYNIEDRNNPELVKEVEIDGYYSDARLIGDYVYVIATESSWNILYEYENEEILKIPTITIDNTIRKISSDQIYYVDVPEKIDTMTHVVSINLENSEVNQKSFMIGSSQNMYVSGNSIYLTYTKYDYNYNYRILDSDSQEMTIIHKISIDVGDISYSAQGEIPGRVLNQFSMDEHDGFFRIATTSGHVSKTGYTSSNNLYILDENLERVSEIEEIAPGERIYSARFMGDKAYLATFKKVDPFFTIDLSDPYSPEILGKLKIPGYSDYLHPYDEDHIIGIGKDTVEAQEYDFDLGPGFAWYQGLKIAIFDVSDFENPIELSKVIIGDRGTTSEALHNHKAFLFDRDKELLVIPVSVFEIPEEIKQQNDGYTGNTHGDFTFQGAYVYQVSLDNGFELKGKISHMNNEDMMKSGYYWYGGSGSISRSLYIDDVLYTISNKMIKMNDLETLNVINSLILD